MAKKSTRKGAKKPKAKSKHKSAPKVVPPSYKVVYIAVDDIKVAGQRRQVNPEKVGELKDSIAKLGLRTPLTIRPLKGGEKRLITGLHRLEAVKALGLKKVPCVYIRGGPRVAELWEISENLHRSGLTTLEENMLIARWLKLTSAGQTISAQNGQKKGPGRPTGGHSAAARALPGKGTETAKRKKIERAVKIAEINPDALQAAIDAGFADSQKKLLQIADQKGKAAQFKRIEQLKKSPSKTKPSASAGSASDSK
jgi:hypothetical protein